MTITDIFEKIKKNAIKINYTMPDKLTLGDSKFGGNPHLPKGFKWPYYTVKNYENVVKCRPLSFLAQINLSKITAYDNDYLLPSKGMLYFFYELDSMKWGFDPKDKGSARVYYYDCDTRTLNETSAPKDIDKDYILPELAISFDSEINLPCYEEFSNYYNIAEIYGNSISENDSEWDIYDELAQKFGVNLYEDAYNLSKMLGYPNVIQNSMPIQVEMVTRGIYCGDGYPKLSQKNQTEIIEASKDWILLFQMGTVGNESLEEFELTWCDGGYIYFYIRKQDLTARNFENIWLILQC